ncbi:DEAD/DEAH box helicase [Kordiimonas aquimaris]|uniref:DEAD/DEAH box helicase n=1 Tax=Kordiimonas aquimaris TaxID=707591 RepID=UPI0021D007F9|nr:DEAD/DEAH box helicase [Kordiimonas aquimaris]
MTEIDGIASGIAPGLAQALANRGYTELTPVQKAMLAPELDGADALVSAQTGSGKTVAFGIAIAPTILEGAERFIAANTPLALVIAPTRELALQVKRELDWLYAPTGAVIASCVGGMDMRTERRNLDRGAHIVVGTPGRLRDHIERASLDMSALRAIVLDEADEMLDLGFRDDLEFMLGSAPETRRTLMFSATVPRTITGLAKRYQRNAVRVTTKTDDKQHLDIEYRAMVMAPSDRENAIINVIRYFDAQNTIIFCSTRATVNHMTARLNNRGFSVVALSGELSQKERTHALQAMRDGRARVCVATDVAARGIDLPGLELVIHADIPKNKEILLHRSGRTGRAGRKGVCTLIVPYNARRRTERLLENAKIDAAWGKPPSVEEITARDNERFLSDPSFTEPVTDEEKPLIEQLMGHHSAEQIATALVRMRIGNQPAPEELTDDGPLRDSGYVRGEGRDRNPRERKPREQRQDFADGTWVSLSVGRKHKAEPRWLLPMLCKAADITKKDIGAIRINDDNTHVELAKGISDKLLSALGPNRKLEKSISVDVLRSPAPATDGGNTERKSYGDKPKRDHKPFDRDKKPYSRDDKKPAWKDKPKNDKPRGEKPAWKDKPKGEKPEWKDKPKADKPYAKKATPAATKAPSPKAEKSAYTPPVGDDLPKVKSKPGKTKPAKDTPKKKKPKWTNAQRKERDAALKAQGKPAFKSANKANKGKSASTAGGDTPLRRKKTD